MDNPSGEPSGALDLNQAAAAFTKAFEPPQPEEKTEVVDTEVDLPAAKVETPEPDKPAEADDRTTTDEPMITVKIDGKDIQVPQSEVIASYQKDKVSTERFMKASELSKAAQAETQKAQQERQAYAANLDQMGRQLEALVEVQKTTDWDALLAADPVEYLRQHRLAEQRQAQLNQVNQQKQQVAAQNEAEAKYAHQQYMQTQQQELLAKLPAWKDEGKAKAEREALKTYLKAEGYDDQAISGISDHKAVLLARKAMLYDQMISKAQAATKKVAALPAKVERPGVADSGALDKRTAAYQRLSKSGSVQDAAAVFSALL